MNQINVPQLPPGAAFQGGRLVRIREVPAEDGSTRKQVRPVAMTLPEAREKLWDYYCDGNCAEHEKGIPMPPHDELGWIVDGYKPQREHPMSSTLVRRIADEEPDEEPESEE